MLLLLDKLCPPLYYIGVFRGTSITWKPADCVWFTSYLLTQIFHFILDNANELDIQTMKAKIIFYDTMVGHDKNVLDFKGSVEYDISKYLYVFLSWTNGESKKVKYLMLNNNQSIRFTNNNMVKQLVNNNQNGISQLFQWI